MNDVDLILADEPTGNLDSQNAAQILDLLTELNQQGKTIILITHDSEVARRCKQVIHLKDGVICEDLLFSTRSPPTETPASPAKEQAADSYSRPISYTPKIYAQIARSVLPLVGENLRRNKGKSLLTMLGVVIGVAAVLAMITLGQFVKSRILETYEALGVNKLKISGYPNWNLKATDQVVVNFRSFNWDRDFSRIKEIFPEVTHASPLLTNGNMKAMALGGSIDDKVAVMGVNPEFLKLTQRMLLAGNNLNIFQVENRSPVCVVGFEIAEQLFARTNPVGQILTLSDGRNTTFPCRIIGVLKSLVSPREWNPPNRNVFIPFTYFQATADSWRGMLFDVSLQVDAQSDVELTGKKIKAYFEQKYGKAGRFNVDSDSTLVAQMKRFLNLFSLLLASIAFLALLIGGIGIHNMMLVSVTDRIKEFGLRKALGATPHSVRIQVLLESVLLCGGAGTLGVLLGFAAYESLIWVTTLFVQNIKFEWVIDPFALVLSTLSILGVGLFSGTVPARKAEKLQVIEALRSE
jgi:macrolide transport system ATP-binding/permease protein